jgi:hypothetical protein
LLRAAFFLTIPSREDRETFPPLSQTNPLTPAILILRAQAAEGVCFYLRTRYIFDNKMPRACPLSSTSTVTVGYRALLTVYRA